MTRKKRVPYTREFRKKADLIPSESFFCRLTRRKEFSLRDFENHLVAAVHNAEFEGSLIVRELLRYDDVIDLLRERKIDVDCIMRGIDSIDKNNRESNQRVERRIEKDELDADETTEERITRQEEVYAFIADLRTRSRTHGKSMPGAVEILKTVLTNLAAEQGAHGIDSDCGVSLFADLDITPARIFPELKERNIGEKNPKKRRYTIDSDDTNADKKRHHRR